MKNVKLLCFLISFIPIISFCQSTFLIGEVADAKTGEKLIGAHVLDLSNKTGTLTNDYGFFSLKTHNTSDTMIVSYVAYRSDTLLDGKENYISIRLVPGVYTDAIVYCD